MAETVAQARSRKERPQTLGSTVEAIDEDPLDLVRRLLLGGHALKLAIRLGEGCGTGLCRIAEMPEHPATDSCGKVHFLCQTAAVLCIRQKIDGERQATPGQYGDQTLLPQRTDQTVERHGR